MTLAGADATLCVEVGRTGRNMGKAGDGKLGLWPVVAIGIGGMVGGGIFAVLGLAVQMARGGTLLAFALAGVVALLTAYSYAKLSVAFPSRGGTVTFLDRAFGAGFITGSLNVLLWLSYVVMLSLYALAFGSYGSTFLAGPWQPLGKHVLITLGVLLLTGLNLLSAKWIGKAESWIVGLKVTILLLFVVAGAAINAMLYGATRLSCCIARDGELPPMLERNVWGQPVKGLLINAALTVAMANGFDLRSISTLGGAGFMLRASPPVSRRSLQWSCRRPATRRPNCVYWR